MIGLTTRFFMQPISTCILHHAGEAARLQQLEVQLLGESSTGYKTEAAQQSPGSLNSMALSMLEGQHLWLNSFAKG